MERVKKVYHRTEQREKGGLVRFQNQFAKHISGLAVPHSPERHIP